MGPGPALTTVTAELGVLQTIVDSEARTPTIDCDRSRVAGAIAQQAGEDEFQAELLPEDKVRAIKSLGTIGPMAMVGNGYAPAFAAASVGLAIGECQAHGRLARTWRSHRLSSMLVGRVRQNGEIG